MRKIEIEPITRLEGHGKITIFLDDSGNVDKVFLIDAPSFNLRLAKLLKKKYPNLEIIYFILPKVWAWKEKRKELVNKLIDVQISIFPFEKDYFPNSFYFGNPLLNSIKYFRDEVVKNSQIAFLPGSRKNEIKNLQISGFWLKEDFVKKILLFQ